MSRDSSSATPRLTSRMSPEEYASRLPILYSKTQRNPDFNEAYRDSVAIIREAIEDAAATARLAPSAERRVDVTDIEIRNEGGQVAYLQVMGERVDLEPDKAINLKVETPPSSTRATTDWIPVSERLPEQPGAVLASWRVDHNEVSEMHYFGDGIFTYNFCADPNDKETAEEYRLPVTHWMPMPAAPGKAPVSATGASAKINYYRDEKTGELLVRPADSATKNKC